MPNSHGSILGTYYTGHTQYSLRLPQLERVGEGQALAGCSWLSSATLWTHVYAIITFYDCVISLFDLTAIRSDIGGYH